LGFDKLPLALDSGRHDKKGLRLQPDIKFNLSEPALMEAFRTIDIFLNFG
jgi:hypothetical protein